MATNVTQVAERDGQNKVTQQDDARARAEVLRPSVDIYEDSEGITLEADMPGVSRERLEVQVIGDMLLVEGKLQFALPEQAEALYADVRSTIYRRTFQLSQELEADKIQANLRDGVLRVRIPKRPERRPRRIEVQSSG